jgi:hypothetical protein
VSWASHAAANLLPFSREKDDLRVELAEFLERGVILTGFGTKNNLLRGLPLAVDATCGQA